MNTPIVYLDWSVLSYLEKVDSLKEEERSTYRSIIEWIDNNPDVVLPYSNAHIHDLMRGNYEKHAEFIDKHLNTINYYSNQVCLTLFWNQPQVTWYYRDAHEYFHTTNDDTVSYNSFRDLLPTIEGHEASSSALADSLVNLLSAVPLPDNFKTLYSTDPIFNIIFPTAKTKMNSLALGEDLLNLSKSMKADFTIYKTLKKFINQARMKMIKDQRVFRAIDKSGVYTDIPKQLIFDEAFEKYLPDSKTSKNQVFDKLTDEYVKLDLKTIGKNSDEKFVNMLDDSLHSFYAAHCDVFVTRDAGCQHKAAEVYKKLKIQTLVMSPSEFVEWTYRDEPNLS